MRQTVYQAIASAAGARHRCIEKGMDDLKLRHKDTIEELIRDYLPH